MKRTLICICLCSLMLANALLLSSCTKEHTKPDVQPNESIENEIKETNNETEEVENTVYIQTTEGYDILSMLPPGESKFDKLVAANEIDSQYNNEFSGCVTDADLTQLQTKYIEKWKEEIDFYYEEILLMLSGETAEKFTEAQSHWETYIELYKETDNEILSPLEHTESSSLNWQLLSHIREEYRERAIHLMYLNYKIGDSQESEKDTDPNVAEENDNRVNDPSVFSLDNYDKEIKQFKSDKVLGPIKDKTDVINKATVLILETFEGCEDRCSPFYAKYDEYNDAWLVQGTLAPNMLGGVPHVLIQGSDGKVLAIWHTK